MLDQQLADWFVQNFNFAEFLIDLNKDFQHVSTVYTCFCQTPVEILSEKEIFQPQLQEKKLSSQSPGCVTLLERSEFLGAVSYSIAKPFTAVFPFLSPPWHTFVRRCLQWKFGTKIFNITTVLFSWMKFSHFFVPCHLGTSHQPRKPCKILSALLWCTFDTDMYKDHTQAVCFFLCIIFAVKTFDAGFFMLADRQTNSLYFSTIQN